MHASDAAAPPASGDPSGRSLFRNTLAVVGGAGFFHLCQLGVVVLINKFASPDVAGLYILALSIATPVMMLCGLELRAAFVADQGRRFTLGTYLQLRTFTTLAGAAALLAVLSVWTWRTGDWAGAALIAMVFAARAAWSLAEVGWGVYQRRERLDLLAVSYVLRGAATIAPFAAVYALLAGAGRSAAATSPEPTALAAALFATGFFLVHWAYDRPRVRDASRWRLDWTASSVVALLAQTAPLGAVSLLITLCDQAPRWIIAADDDPRAKAQLGYFGSLAYVTLAGNLLMVQAATAAANRLALHYRCDWRRFLALTARLLAAATILGALLLTAALFAGRTALTWLYTPDYARFKPDFIIILSGHALALLTIVLGVAITQMGWFWVQVPMQALTLAATLAAACWLIPGDDPVRGAAWTGVVRTIVQFLLYAPCFVWGLLAAIRRQTTSAAPPGGHERGLSARTPQRRAAPARRAIGR